MIVQVAHFISLPGAGCYSTASSSRPGCQPLLLACVNSSWVSCCRGRHAVGWLLTVYLFHPDAAGSASARVNKLESLFVERVRGGLL
jgi:hypothetical protein